MLSQTRFTNLRDPANLRTSVTMVCLENDSCVYQRPLFPTAALCAHENDLWAAQTPIYAPCHIYRPTRSARNYGPAHTAPRGRVAPARRPGAARQLSLQISGPRGVTRPRRDGRVVRPARPRAPTTRHRIAGPLCYEAWGPESMRVLKVCWWSPVWKSTFAPHAIDALSSHWLISTQPEDDLPGVRRPDGD